MADPNFVFYHYDPSLIAAAIFCALFGLSTLLHAYQLLRTRSAYMIPLIIGCLFEVIGYIGRIISSLQSPNYGLAPYIIQTLLLLVAPAFLAATIYMILGYIILAVDAEHHSLIRKNLLTKIFVIGDFFSFMIQSTGASLQSKPSPSSKTAGTYIIIGGLAIQLLFLSYFLTTATIFTLRLHRNPTPFSLSTHSPTIRWRKHTLTLLVTSTLILVRSVFRTVEYAMGTDGYLVRSEVWLYVFDAGLMAAVVGLLNLVHPSEITAAAKGTQEAIEESKSGCRESEG